MMAAKCILIKTTQLQYKKRSKYAHRKELWEKGVKSHPVFQDRVFSEGRLQSLNMVRETASVLRTQCITSGDQHLPKQKDLILRTKTGHPTLLFEERRQKRDPMTAADLLIWGKPHIWQYAMSTS